ncbi:Unknown protein sequence [Pseudomonas syringae pv. aceris]|nr:Unknown protein sequence [Pseudomonas syringae pv. aceris]
MSEVSCGFSVRPGVGPGLYASVDMTLSPRRFCHHCSISLR